MPFAVKNALVDPDLCFPIFYFPKFHLFRPLPCRVFVFLVFFVATRRLEVRGERLEAKG